MLQVEYLRVKYAPNDQRCALDDVSFSIQDGERVALLGANGAGKSSLLLALVGILPIQAGTITVDGVRLDKETLTAIRQKLGLVFQNPDDQLFMPTVFQDVAFGPRNYGLDETETSLRVDATLEALGIAHLRERMVHKLSGGEKRMAALAGVLAMEPSALLLDEPTSFLDFDATERLAGCLLGLGQSLLLTTHDLGFAGQLCNRFLFLSHGKLSGDYTRETLVQNPAILNALGYNGMDGGTCFSNMNSSCQVDTSRKLK